MNSKKRHPYLQNHILNELRDIDMKCENYKTLESPSHQFLTIIDYLDDNVKMFHYSSIEQINNCKKCKKCEECGLFIPLTWNVNYVLEELKKKYKIKITEH